jgi:glucose/arabinose dehydrogenase
MRQTRTAFAPPRARLYLDQLEDRTTPATLPTGFTEAAVATGLASATAMEVAPNGDLWVLEQGGGVKRFRTGSPAADLVANLSSVGLRSEGERGVLGIAFDPGYATNKFVYVYYTSSDAPNPHNRISRFTVDDATAADYSFVDTVANPAPLDEVEILNLDPLSAATNHNGGAIHFGPDGKLYVAVGDNALGSNAQSISTRHGKILRINADGTIPADNPTSIAGIAGTTTGANRAIWAAGVRNPFTFTFQPGTGAMLINDVGQNTWEEVNVGGAGRNYGWPGTEGDFNQASFPNFTRPLYAYSHGGGTFQGFAVTGGAFYNPAATQFPAEYAGDYFFADYVNDWVNVMNADGTDVRRFATNAPGTVDLRVAADGSLLYLARDANQVFRVTFTGSQAPAITQQPRNATASVGGTASFTVAASGTAPLAYQWQKFDGTAWQALAEGGGVAGATTATLSLTAVDAADAGQYRVVVTNSAGAVTSNATTLTVVMNQAPSGTIAITSGLTNGRFIAGQTIGFSGTGTDPEDGTLAAAAFTWRVDYVTSIASGNPVVRPFLPEFSGTTGSTLTPATTGPYTLTDVAYRITLTVTDSAGLTTTRTLDVTPNVANITLRTKPVGGTLTIDGQPVASGSVIPSVVGFQRPIGAPATQTINGTSYTFRSWSDGGAGTHTISTPLANTTYTANYKVQRGNSASGKSLLAALPPDTGTTPGGGQLPTDTATASDAPTDRARAASAGRANDSTAGTGAQTIAPRRTGQVDAEESLADSLDVNGDLTVDAIPPRI